VLREQYRKTYEYNYRVWRNRSVWALLWLWSWWMRRRDVW